MRNKIVILIFIVTRFVNSFSQNDTTNALFLKSDDFRNTVMKYLKYPELAAENGIQGKVVLNFRVNSIGCIDSIIVVESPDITLSRATIEALNKVKCDWTPAKKDGEPVAVWLTYPTTFTLQSVGEESKGHFSSIGKAIKNPDAVRFLKLTDKKLSEVPKEVFSFPNLFTLDLENNEITTVSKEIQNCKKLNFLLLGGNKINSLPAEISNLKKLYKIDLSDNGLIASPNEVYNLKNLWELDLSDNQLTSLPADIGNLRKLRYLYLANNKLEKLPEEALNMTKLYRIDLQGNNFSDSEKELIKSKLLKTEILF